MAMVRNGNGTKWHWYEMAMVRNGYGTKMSFTMVLNGRYEMVMVRNDCNSYLLLGKFKYGRMYRYISTHNFIKELFTVNMKSHY